MKCPFELKMKDEALDKDPDIRKILDNVVVEVWKDIEPMWKLMMTERAKQHNVKKH